MVELEFREIRIAEWEVIERIGRLRMRAWLTETPQAVEMTTWIENIDREARHWAFLRNGEPVAAARLSVHVSIDDVPDSEAFAGASKELFPTPIASFSRLIVAPSFRGIGLSKRLDMARLAEAEKSGCRCAVLTTSFPVRRLRQLQEMGFMVVGQGTPCPSPPLCYAPPPLLLVCRLPRIRAPNPESVEIDPSPGSTGAAGG